MSINPSISPSSRSAINVIRLVNQKCPLHQLSNLMIQSAIELKCSIQKDAQLAHQPHPNANVCGYTSCNLWSHQNCGPTRALEGRAESPTECKCGGAPPNNIEMIETAGGLLD